MCPGSFESLIDSKVFRRFLLPISARNGDCLLFLFASRIFILPIRGLEMGTAYSSKLLTYFVNRCRLLGISHLRIEGDLVVNRLQHLLQNQLINQIPSLEPKSTLLLYGDIQL